MPEYLESIPSPEYYGSDWDYTAQMQRSKFVLGVSVDSPWVSNLGYYSSLDEWVVDTK